MTLLPLESLGVGNPPVATPRWRPLSWVCIPVLVLYTYCEYQNDGQQGNFLPRSFLPATSIVLAFSLGG